MKTEPNTLELPPVVASCDPVVGPEAAADAKAAVHGSVLPVAAHTAADAADNTDNTHTDTTNTIERATASPTNIDNDSDAGSMSTTTTTMTAPKTEPLVVIDQLLLKAAASPSADGVSDVSSSASGCWTVELLGKIPLHVAWPQLDSATTLSIAIELQMAASTPPVVPISVSQVSVVPIPMTSKQIAQQALYLYALLNPYADDFLHPSSALAWLSRARPARTGKITVPPEHRWPKSVHGAGGYMEAFRQMGLTQRVHETKLGHWHWWYWCPKRVCLEAMQLALVRRHREAQLRAFSIGVAGVPNNIPQMPTFNAPSTFLPPNGLLAASNQLPAVPSFADVNAAGGKVVGGTCFPGNSITWNYPTPPMPPPTLLPQPQQVQITQQQLQTIVAQQQQPIVIYSTNVSPASSVHSTPITTAASPRVERLYSRMSVHEQPADRIVVSQPVAVQPLPASASTGLPFAQSQPVSPQSLLHKRAYAPYSTDRRANLPSPPMPAPRRNSLTSSVSVSAPSSVASAITGPTTPGSPSTSALDTLAQGALSWSSSTNSAFRPSAFSAVKSSSVDESSVILSVPSTPQSLPVSMPLPLSMPVSMQLQPQAQSVPQQLVMSQPSLVTFTYPTTVSVPVSVPVGMPMPVPMSMPVSVPVTMAGGGLAPTFWSPQQPQRMVPSYQMAPQTQPLTTQTHTATYSFAPSLPMYASGAVGNGVGSFPVGTQATMVMVPSTTTQPQPAMQLSQLVMV